MKTLLVNAHPDFRNMSHFSNQLEQRFITEFRTHFTDQDLTIFNLYENEIPRIEDGQLWSLWNKQYQQIKLTAAETDAFHRSNELLEQFKTHHRIVIVSPLHNFNITSRMKDYLDNILIARETFRYLKTPLSDGKASTGLMTDDYRALLLLASGSVYTRPDFYSHIDFAPQYLQTIFQEIMGFDQFGTVRAEGTATLSENTVLAKADGDLKVAFDKLYR